MARVCAEDGDDRLIHVPPQPEPPEFDQLVRSRGKRFLLKHPRPTSKLFATHAYWVDIHPQLRRAFRGICAYTCHWISEDTGWKTVEHFRAKERYPNLAYEWTNYRYVCGLVNGRKGIAQDVIDPFKLMDGWFVIDFPTLIVRAGAHLPTARRNRVKATIERLRLNDEPTCISARQSWLREYYTLAKSNEKAAFNFLERYAPFLAKELDRQRLRGSNELGAGV